MTNTLTPELIDFLELFHVDIKSATVVLRHVRAYSIQLFLEFANKSLPEIIREVTLEIASVHYQVITKFVLIITFMKSVLNMGEPFRVHEGFSNLKAEDMPENVNDFTWYEISFFEDTMKHVLAIIEKMHSKRQEILQRKVDERDQHVQELADQYSDAWNEQEQIIDLTHSSDPAGTSSSKRSAFSPPKGTPDKETTSPDKKKTKKATFVEDINDEDAKTAGNNNAKRTMKPTIINTHVDGRKYYEDPGTGELKWLDEHFDIKPDQHLSTNVRKNHAASLDMARHDRVAKQVVRGGFGRGDPRSIAGRGGRGGRGAFNTIYTQEKKNPPPTTPNNDGAPLPPPHVRRETNLQGIYRPPQLRGEPPKYPDWLHNPQAPAPEQTTTPSAQRNLYGDAQFQIPAGHVSIPPARFHSRSSSSLSSGRTAKHKVRRSNSNAKTPTFEPAQRYSPTIYLPPDEDDHDRSPDSYVTYAHPWAQMSTTPPRKRSAIDFKAVWNDKDKTIPEIVDIVHSWMLTNMMTYIMTADFKAAYLTGGVDLALPYTYGLTLPQLLVDRAQTFAAIQSVLRQSNRAAHLVSKHRTDSDGFSLWYDFLGEFNNEQDTGRRMNVLRNLASQNWHPNYPGGIKQYLNNYLHYNNQMEYLDPWFQQHEYVPDNERIARLGEMFVDHPMSAHIQSLCDSAPLFGYSLDDFIQKLKKALAPTEDRRSANYSAAEITPPSMDLPAQRSAYRAAREQDHTAYQASIHGTLQSYENDEDGPGDPLEAMQNMVQAMMAYRDQQRTMQSYHPDYRLTTPAYQLMKEINEKWTHEYDRRRRQKGPQGAPSGGEQ